MNQELILLLEELSTKVLELNTHVLDTNRIKKTMVLNMVANNSQGKQTALELLEKCNVLSTQLTAAYQVNEQVKNFLKNQ